MVVVGIVLPVSMILSVIFAVFITIVMKCDVILLLLHLLTNPSLSLPSTSLVFGHMVYTLVSLVDSTSVTTLASTLPFSTLLRPFYLVANLSFPDMLASMVPMSLLPFPYNESKSSSSTSQ